MADAVIRIMMPALFPDSTTKEGGPAFQHGITTQSMVHDGALMAFVRWMLDLSHYTHGD